MIKHPISLILAGIWAGLAITGVCLILSYIPDTHIIHKHVTACILPPSYFVNQNDRTKSFVYQKRQNLTNKTATDINDGSRTKNFARKKATNKQKLISKETVNSDCKRAYELCKRDRGCYAKGCIELSYYLKGLCKSKSECLKRS